MLDINCNSIIGNGIIHLAGVANLMNHSSFEFHCSFSFLNLWSINLNISKADLAVSRMEEAKGKDMRKKTNSSIAFSCIGRP